MTAVVAGAVLSIGLLGAACWYCYSAAGARRRGARFHRARSADVDDDDDDDDDYDDEDDDDDNPGPGGGGGRTSTSLARIGGKEPKGGTMTKVAPKASNRAKGRPIKIFVEMGGEVHVLRIAMQPVESVDDLHDALSIACAESGAPELRDLDFSVDASIELQYLDDGDNARPVTDDTPIGLLKCAKAMRAFRSA